MQAAFRLALVFAAVAVAAPLSAASLGSATSNEGFTIDLTSVERKGNVVTVKWAVKNDNPKAKYYDIDLAGKGATSYLVDEESGTKYYALTDKEGNLLATETEYDGIYESIEPGETKRFWAKFPAPPPAVKTINVLFSKSDPFESIAITDK
ncbi:MAG TPA: hypothetical protein VMR21_17435 [Vicinamibacteria bacterium]|nr:hypothetical protein [Vicinamibacteria bacterium]